jgi:dTDP-glucose 4,6-dehydratase
MRHSGIDKNLRGVLDALKNSVEPLNGGHIFLTGGTGFLGKWLIESFLHLNKVFALDARLTVLSRDPHSFLSSCPWFKEAFSLDVVQGDVRDYTVSHGTFDFIIHAATDASTKLEQENPAEMHSVIVDGTRHVLDFAQRCSAKKMLYISSGAVYGAQPPTLSHIPESYEGSPTTSYGKGKKLAEQLCLEAAAGRFECVIARPFACVGPYLPLDAHFAIGNFMSDCLNNRPIMIKGDGTPLRSYLYAADLVEWLWTILLRGEHGRAYNMGSDDAISIFDLAHLVRQCAGTSNEIIILKPSPHSDAEISPSRYIPSIDRVRNELGLTPAVSLTDAIQQTLTWHKSPH